MGLPMTKRSTPWRALAFGLATLCVTGSVASTAALQGEATAPGREPATLTLESALQLALDLNPGLQAQAAELRAAAARTTQAGARTNPTLSMEIENVSGDLPGFRESEATVSLGRVFERGGKRDARLGVAQARGHVAMLASDAASRALVAETTKRFLEAVAAHRAAALQQATADIAAGIALSVAQRTRAGAVSPAEEARALLELETARLEWRDALSRAEVSTVRLTALWGEFGAPPRLIAADFESLTAIPERESLGARLDRSPSRLRLLADSEMLRAQLVHARSQRAMDVELQAGVRHLAGSNDNTLLAGLSTTLPLFPAGARGGVAEASSELAKVGFQLDDLRLALTVDLYEKHTAVTRADRRVRGLRTVILPMAERAFRDVQVGYQNGRFGYVDLLEARRALTRARQEELSGLLDFHLAVVDLELLLGSPLEPTSEGP
jgi:cobalt-zinc-cadmium efflux system outer membrane protein